MIDPKVFGLVTAMGFGIAPVLLKVAFRHGGAMTLGLMLGQLSTLSVNLALLLVIDAQLMKNRGVKIVY